MPRTQAERDAQRSQPLMTRQISLVSPLDESAMNLIVANLHAGTPIPLPDAITQEDRERINRRVESLAVPDVTDVITGGRRRRSRRRRSRRRRTRRA